MAVNKYAPFKRGVMRFEDYNYRMYNQYILIDQQNANKGNAYNNLSRIGGDSTDQGPKLT